MSSPFDKCAVLDIAKGKLEAIGNSVFKGTGRLLCMVDRHGFATHFILPGGVFMKPDEVNTILAEADVSVRVDDEGKAYALDEVIGG